MTIWDCRTHVRMTSMTSSVERTDLDFKISVALLDTYLSLSFHNDTLPEYLLYTTTRRKNTLPSIENLPHLPHPRHLGVHTCTHLTLPFITYPNLHFPTLYYCQGLIKYKAEMTYQIGRNHPGPKRLRPKRPKSK